MVEGAIAHYQATGKRNFLDIAIRYADCVCREIGTGEGQQIRVPGHQIAEMALAKLYLVTGQQKYLDQAKFFLDQRGYTTRTDEYSQAHKPVVEQDEAVGHAVRAAYMYAGMADVAALTGRYGLYPCHRPYLGQHCGQEILYHRWHRRHQQWGGFWQEL